MQNFQKILQRWCIYKNYCVLLSSNKTYSLNPVHINKNTTRRGVLCLKGNIEERACNLVLYIIENNATVRGAAKQFSISKSTVHTVVTI